MRIQLEYYPPTFVAGCAHSGNTLMNAIIGSHSNIHLIKRETRMFIGSTKKLNGFMQGLYDEANDNGKCRWTEKTAGHINFMDKLLGINTAKIILMIRDGRDVVYSLYKREGQIHRAVTKWNRECQITLQYSDHPRTMLVKYEDLVTDFERIMTGVFEFIGEKYEEGVVRFYESYEKTTKPPDETDGKNHMQLRRWQLSQPLFDGRGRYKEFSEKQYKYVLSRQRKMLLELGYIE